MKSITIHGIHDKMDKLIRNKANKHGLSLNKTIKNLLEQALGLQRQTNSDHRDDFLDLFGIWKKEDLKQFKQAIRDLEKIDARDWQ